VRPGSESVVDGYLLVECKAYSSSKELPREDIIKFFTETVPAYKNHMADKQPIRRLRAELWTTGVVSAESTKLLDTIIGAGVARDYAIMPAAKIEVPNDIKSAKRLLECIGAL
jgi:hypothetical protein